MKTPCRFLSLLLVASLALPSLQGCTVAAGDDESSDEATDDSDLVALEAEAARASLVFIDNSGRRTDLANRNKCIAGCVPEGIALVTILKWVAAGTMVVVGAAGTYWATTQAGRVGPFQTKKEASDYYLQAKKVSEKLKGQLRAKAREQKLPLPGDEGAQETYEPPTNHTDGTKLPKGTKNGKSGFVDKKGRVWSKGPSRTKGEDFEWDVQTDGGGHINVSQKGVITH
jgi:hypothetical protein